MTAGESAAASAARKRATAEKYRQRMERAERDAAMYERGADGEIRLSPVLAALTNDGYQLLEDRGIPASDANVDFVLVGPAGVIIVDAKNWSGELKIDGMSLRQDGRRRDPKLESLRFQAVQVAAVLEDFKEAHGTPPLVRPVMCFVGSARIGRRTAVDRVHLIDADELCDFVHALPKLLDHRTVTAIHNVLAEQLPPRTAPRADRRDDILAPPTEELLVFLNPWSKQGRRRLYVKNSDGVDVGFLDLESGAVEPNRAEWLSVFTQLLPHYMFADVGGQNEASQASARSRLQNFLGTVLRRRNPAVQCPILAGYHWQKYGNERLYLHRIECGRPRIELGWFDLEAGRVGDSLPESEALVGYCGWRFRSVARKATSPG